MAATRRLRAEVPQPAPPERAPGTPSIRVSPAADWVAGMQRAIRDFAREQDAPAPFVRVTLEDGETLDVQALAPGPGADFVAFTTYDAEGGPPRVSVVRLDLVRKVELSASAPPGAAATLAFRPRAAAMGFAQRR